MTSTYTIPWRICAIHDELVKIGKRWDECSPEDKSMMMRRARSEKYYAIPKVIRLVYAVGAGDGITTCWHCGRLLTDALSVERGVGPICYGRHGPMPGRP